MDSASSRPATTKRSKVWDHFERENNNNVKCKLCFTHLLFSGGSTGTMLNHLKHKHKSIHCEETKVQTKINTYKAPVLSKDRWNSCTQKLALLCAVDLRLLSICEGLTVWAFCGELNPSYTVPSKQTVTNHLKKIFATEKELLINDILNHCMGIAMMSDLWTSQATEAYITVTGHYLDSNWTLHNVVLTTREVTDRHTGENLANELRSITSEFHIPLNKITALITDNASNMTLRCDNLGWLSVKCFAHTLQLCIRSAFDKIRSINHAIGSTKKLLTFFQKSVLASNELTQRQKQMGLLHHSLIIDCATRWNSTYEMFDRLIEQRLAVYAVLHSNVVKDSQAKVLDITDKDWEVIQDIVPVLQPLYIATRVLCSEQYPTLSGVMPIMYSLLEIHLKTKDADSNVVKNFKDEVSQDLKRRFKTETEDVCKNIRMMCFMDPRYKGLPFLTPAQRDVVHREIICYCQKLAQSESQVTGVAADSSVPQHQSAEVIQVPNQAANYHKMTWLICWVIFMNKTVLLLFLNPPRLN
ncbi:E3 SUMO-protein ligase ZBED1-like [Tachypleus tridentatus]|uniref:E3 SUMO-protein ligase ZBED1-like n=1 Tax=Tachypleus tridentatus TaxID=6853 RepID=UPI003FD490B4